MSSRDREAVSRWAAGQMKLRDDYMAALRRKGYNASAMLAGASQAAQATAGTATIKTHPADRARILDRGKKAVARLQKALAMKAIDATLARLERAGIR